MIIGVHWESVLRPVNKHRDALLSIKLNFNFFYRQTLYIAVNSIFLISSDLISNWAMAFHKRQKKKVNNELGLIKNKAVKW